MLLSMKVIHGPLVPQPFQKRLESAVQRGTPRIIRPALHVGHRSNATVARCPTSSTCVNLTWEIYMQLQCQLREKRANMRLAPDNLPVSSCDTVKPQVSVMGCAATAHPKPLTVTIGDARSTSPVATASSWTSSHWQHFAMGKPVYDKGRMQIPCPPCLCVCPS